MIFKLFKSLVKIVFLSIVSIIALLVIIVGTVNGTKEYIEEKRNVASQYDTVPNMISDYEKNAQAVNGTWCVCPVCGNYFYKNGLNCCSEKCEKEYHEIVKAWCAAK